MSTSSANARPILVTGAAGEVGAVGRTVTQLLRADGFAVRALVRREDARADALRRMGATVVQADLTDLDAMHRAIEGCASIYFGMSISPAYLEATINTAAVARHHGVDAFVNMSQMTVSQMSITQTTASPQQKLHWLSEQALGWSGLPVVTVRPTVFLEGFFHRFAATNVRDRDELALPLGSGKTSPIAAEDVARVVAAILGKPSAHVGRAYDLTGHETADLPHYAEVLSDVLGRRIRYRDVPLPAWNRTLREAGVPEHLVNHLSAMAALHAQGRYDRMTDDVLELTGRTPMSMREFVCKNIDDYKITQSTG